MNKSYNKAERSYLERIKSMPCIVCGQPAPSEAHHIRQDSAWYCVPLCVSCHSGVPTGIHSMKTMWKVMKMDEVDAMAKLIEVLSNAQKQNGKCPQTVELD